MKLSKAQQEVMDKAKAKIDFARNHTVREWSIYENFGVLDINECCFVKNYERYGWSKEKATAVAEEEVNSYINNYSKYYEDNRNGIVLTHSNSRTIRRLEDLGLIEIIWDACGESYGIDTIKILNY